MANESPAPTKKLAVQKNKIAPPKTQYEKSVKKVKELERHTKTVPDSPAPKKPINAYLRFQ